MRLVLDQGLPVSAASILRTAGWDVVHASEAGLNRATDQAMLEFAPVPLRMFPAFRSGHVCFATEQHASESRHSDTHGGKVGC